MTLMHGTTLRHAPHIARLGLQPRAVTRNSNWPKAPSSPGSVYLTNCYALYFASQAMDMDDSALIIEVKPDEARLHADEDWLEQSTRDYDMPMSRKELVERTKACALQAPKEPWQPSLAGLGTCAHNGPIGVAQLGRCLIIEPKAVVRLIVQWHDPFISLINHRIKGADNEAFHLALFGDLQLPGLDRSGVKMVQNVSELAIGATNGVGWGISLTGNALSKANKGATVY